MKILKVLFLLLLFVMSCTSEPDIHDFTAVLTNESGHELTVYFRYDGELIKMVALSNLESTSCKYSEESFDEFRRCDGNMRINSITIMFSNEMGYTCNYLSPASEQIFCFGESRNPLLSGFNETGNKQYEFIITEEDFNNAHDLPE